MRTSIALFALLAIAASPGRAQGPDAGEGLRIGVSLGGISTFAIDVELFRDSQSIDFAVGTWSFRDLSLSAVVRQYFGAGSAKPVVGAGLWVVGAPGDDRTGWALVLRAPVGVDWAMAEDHALGVFLNVNRALWVRRANPADQVPLNRRLVPLPELYYRYTR